jgi:hypothetical protein
VGAVSAAVAVLSDSSMMAVALAIAIVLRSMIAAPPRLTAESLYYSV